VKKIGGIDENSTSGPPVDANAPESLAFLTKSSNDNGCFTDKDSGDNDKLISGDSSEKPYRGTCL
jgi:hypothetical protein